MIMAAEIRILSTAGKLYKTELWDNSKTAQGIAVFDLEINHQFVIGLDPYNCYFCSDKHAYTAEIEGDWYYADDDFKDKLDGFNATNSLLRKYTENDETYILTYCKTLNAYLGTFGEHKIIYENISKIKEAFAILGKTFNNVYQSTPYIYSIYADDDYESAEFELIQVSYQEDYFHESLITGGGVGKMDYYLFYKYDGSLEENDVKPRTISENLQIIKNSTDAIKQAIIDKGGTIEGDITTWANAISGLSGGGSGESAEEIVFRGSKSTQATSVSYTGVLYAPNNINRGYLVLMDYYMILRTSFCSINGSSTDINMSINYDEPLGGTMYPILILMYSLPGDAYGQWRSQIVKIIDDGSGN